MRWPWQKMTEESADQVFEDQTKVGKYDDQYVLLQKINKIYGHKFHAVHDFSLCIRKKEFVVFVGPSGCGKSTTLRMIAGLEDISSGSLYIDGELANNLLARDRDIAMVFQNYALYPNMSVFDNMAFALKVRKNRFPVYELKDKEKFEEEKSRIKAEYKDERSAEILKLKHKGSSKEEIQDYIYLSNLSEKLAIREVKKNYLSPVLDEKGEPVFKYRHYKSEEIIEKVCNAAHILEIVDQLKKKPKELSGGQRQRVALGRAIVRNAKIFLMDEPLSNLDAKLRVQMRSEIIDLHKKINATTIYVTHDQTEAMTMADRIVVMKDGYIQQIGTPMEIYQHPRNLFVASFIGSPAMNLVHGVYDDGSIKFSNGQSVKLNKEIIKKHDEFYAKLYAETKREYPNLVEELNKEKAEFEASKHTDKDAEEFASKYKELIDKEDNLINKLDDIIHGGKHEIIFGIRPESIVESNSKQAIDVNVRLSELLGDQYFIHFDFGGKDFLSKISADKLIESGTKMKLEMLEDKIHIFDEESEMAIL